MKEMELKSKEIEKKYLEIFKGIKKEYMNRRNENNESYHYNIDETLIDFLKEIGYKKLAKAYDEASDYFWYS